MKWLQSDKRELIEEIRRKMKDYPEIRRVILFGSFLESETPNDLDLAIIQESEESYLALALRYRKALRTIAEKIPLDLLPLNIDAKGAFLEEVRRGTVIYEKRDSAVA